MKARILPALAALVALLKRPFRRKPKVKMYQGPGPVTRDPGRGPSLRGNGKASRRLRQARRAALGRSFTRFLAHRPMLVGQGHQGFIGLLTWHRLFAAYMRRFDERSRASVRLGRRAEKRSRRLHRVLDVRALRKERGGISRREYERVTRLLEVAS